jgi:hypothetical protein
MVPEYVVEYSAFCKIFILVRKNKNVAFWDQTVRDRELFPKSRMRVNTFLHSLLK